MGKKGETECKGTKNNIMRKGREGLKGVLV